MSFFPITTDLIDLESKKKVWLLYNLEAIQPVDYLTWVLFNLGCFAWSYLTWGLSNLGILTSGLFNLKFILPWDNKMHSASF